MSQPLDDYGNEATVDLRAQRLRRAEATEVETDTDVAPAPEQSDDTAPADPYGVGQEALERAHSPTAAQSPTNTRSVPGLFADTDPRLDADPAEWGWRGRVNAAVGTRLRARDDSAELAHRANVHTIRQAPPGIVTIASPKGGSGKTPTTLMLAATLGQHRAGVVAWDAAESGGTLADRAGEPPQASIADVLDEAPRLASGEASAAEMAGYLTRQSDGHEVLGADMASSVEVGADECAAVMAVLRRHRDLLLIDTGTNTHAPSWLWATSHADALVIPVPLRRDAAKGAWLMCRALIDAGHEQLVRSARVLLTVTPSSSRSLESDVAEGLHELGVERFSRLPYDPALASGERIRSSTVSPTTRQAFTEAAADLVRDLAETTRTTLLRGTEDDNSLPTIPRRFQ